jgi:hypothetical protein
VTDREAVVGIDREHIYEEIVEKEWSSRRKGV